MAKGKQKGSRLDQLTTQFALRQDMGEAVYTDEIVHKALFDEDGTPVYFVKKGELKDFAEKKAKEDPDFDIKGFVEFLQGIKHPKSGLGVIKEGGAGGGGSRATTINSMERIYEVVNKLDAKGNPLPEETVEAYAQECKKLLDMAIDIRTRLDARINQNASFSLALKNKNTGEDKQVDESEADENSENETEDED